MQLLLGLYDALMVPVLSLEIVPGGVLNPILTSSFLVHHLLVKRLLVRESEVQIIDYELLLAVD
jgi:hypothetical protein